MNVQNPSIVYAGIWKFQRRPWTFVSGGDENGLYRSSDGGETWTKLEGHGLPSGPTGRIGLAVAPSDGNRVYALIESSQGILWRSQDGGANWTMVSNDSLVNARPFYFSHVEVDPKNPNRVYALSFQVMLSNDGGKTFKSTADNVHSDFHAIWIAPNDPARIVLGEDGGYALTLDGGDNWFFSANLADRTNLSCRPRKRQSVYGLRRTARQQRLVRPVEFARPVGDPEQGLDRHGRGRRTMGDSRSRTIRTGFGPTHRTVRLSSRTASRKTAGWDSRTCRRRAKADHLATSKYRFNWESPIAFAPWRSSSGKLIGWYGGNVVFQTTDRGRSWTPVSPDLTRNMKAHQVPAGGPITIDVSGAEYTGTILDIEGSERSRGEIWVGTDDGLVQLTRDGGKHWSNVTPPGAPEFARFATVAPSTLVAGTAYAIADGHYVGDSTPYAFVTHDYGRHWTKIVNGLPADQWARAIRPDIHTRDLVYLGTEQGIWISFDGGATWQSFENNLPAASVRDIRMQKTYDDLVIATHGRAAYVMDDMRPVQQLAQAIARSTWLFTPRQAYEWSLTQNDEGTYTNYAADNPPYRRVDHVLPKGAAEERAGVGHPELERPRRPQRFRNAQSAR